MSGLRSEAVSLVVLVSAVLSLARVEFAAAGGERPGFVRARGTRFEVDGKPYVFLGANLWYGAHLGAAGSAGGDRARLGRELDRLADLGVRNLRVLASTQGPESEPWRIVPVLEAAPGRYDRAMLEGLDWLLREMGSRQMRAVVCLGNFWPWSGGMSQYLSWFGGGLIPYPPPAPGGSWDAYQAYTERFYSDARAVAAAAELIRNVVTRVNSFTQTRYSDDPTIMAWELANEPRGGRQARAFNEWIRDTSAMIKALDPDHLVTTGSEGETPWPEANGLDLVLNHSHPGIDYVTAHVWAQNWSWFDPAAGMAGLPSALAKMDAYLRSHAAKAALLGKPFVVEEFGLGRDEASHDPRSSTRVRDLYYAELLGRIYELARMPNAQAAGANFWAWAGEGRPKAPYGGHWARGDAWIGDPPHEPQGWYSVYDSDGGTLRVIREYAAKMSALGRKKLAPLIVPAKAWGRRKSKDIGASGALSRARIERHGVAPRKARNPAPPLDFSTLHARARHN